MDRTPPTAGNEEIELYVRTIYSLLRSTGPIRLRSLEETHVGMNSSLHYRAGSSEIEMAALSYSAMRLPPCFPDVSMVVLGQMEEVFRRRGFSDVESWPRVKARARRRKMYFDADRHILAAFIASVSDIDDMIPCMVTYQIEWNKLHDKLLRNRSDLACLRLPEPDDPHDPSAVAGALSRLSTQDLSIEDLSSEDLEVIRSVLELTPEDFERLQSAWPGRYFVDNLRKAAVTRMDVRLNVLGSGLSDYRKAVQIWWQQLEEDFSHDLAERPVYFVSSNTHSIVNLLSGFVPRLRDEIISYVLAEKPEGLDLEYQRLQEEHHDQFGNFLYYASRLFLNHPRYAERAQRLLDEQEAAAGSVRVSNPRCLDVEAQLIEIGQLVPEWFDSRLGQFSQAELDLLRQSDALILNIDYPLGMAAYHVLSQVSTAVSGDLLGAYVLGKAATLNGRVGDVMIPNVVYDEHSKNTFLFRNCFTAQDVAPFLNYGTVFDNQKGVTVRGTFLQNRDFMHVFYEESYTDIEMEAGPYLSAIYEDIYPRRYPLNEIVNIFINAPYDIGILHYASDTPISRRQTLLSKSMSYFGVDATYATSIPVVRRILHQEIARQQRLRRDLAKPHQPVPVSV
ncbi:MAG: hypothetical protein R2873_13240 [Caldilineaceae bacterium]